MGKGREGDLWDDSALISAFDDAMSKHKKMHGKKNQGSPPEVGEVISGADESIPDTGEEDSIDPSVAVTDEVAAAGETSNLLSAKGDTSAVKESYPDSSNFLPANDAVNGYPYPQSTEDYNQILTEYYKLEAKKEKLLQKLHQYGSWNYQAEPSASYPSVQQWHGAHPSQEHAVPTDQISHSIDSCACCPYFCQSFVAPCPASASCFGGTVVGHDSCSALSSVPRDSLPLKDCDITRTAIEAAAKAISSLKLDGSNINIGKEPKEERFMGETASSETDITDVLSAWYSAGFYTGKYLVEKSIQEKRLS